MSSPSTEDGDQKKKSQAIDRTLEEDSKKLRRECKILLLGRHYDKRVYSTEQLLTVIVGSGESGKSTIVKQMKIIHQNGYTADELALYRHTVYKNLVDCAKALIAAMKQFEIAPENPGTVEQCEYMNEYSVDPDPNSPLSPKVADAINAIWKDPCVPKIFEHSSEFYLMDSAS